MASTLARRAAALALGAALALAGPVAAETVSLGRAEARALAAQAMGAGDAGLARRIAVGLIDANAADRDAWLLLAAADIRLGEPAAARAAAAEAHRLSGTPGDRYEAARIVALAANQEGRHALAVWWLRRALLVAPDAEEAARTRADAAQVQGQAVWRSAVKLSFTPSDNVNGGSDSAYLLINGVPIGDNSIDAQSLSGWVGTLDAKVTRRLAEDRLQRTELRFHVYGRGVALSDESKARIAEANEVLLPGQLPSPGHGAAFGYVLTEAGISHERLVGSALIGGELSASAAWSGGEAYTRGIELGGHATLPFGDGRQVSLATSVEQRWYEGLATPDLPASLQLSWSAPLPNRDRVTLTAIAARTWSDNGNHAFSSWTAQATYALARQVGPARLSATLGYQEVSYPDYALFVLIPGGRQDDRVFANVEAVLGGYEIAGFAPVVTVRAATADSNLSRFEVNEISLGFGFQSSF